MALNIGNVTTLTFDCYGTLIDWESGIWDGFQPLLMANESRLTRHETLEAFARIESSVQAETPGLIYPQVLREVHRRFAANHDYETTPAMDDRFGDFVPYWPAFPDSADALRRLAEKFRLVILSNVNRDGFAASEARLGTGFDVIYTAEDIGSYKPNPENFRHMLAALEADHATPAGTILHVAQSLFHDIEPAQQFGMQTAWIDRQNLAGGGSWGATARTASMPEPDAVFPTLMAFADTVC